MEYKNPESERFLKLMDFLIKEKIVSGIQEFMESLESSRSTYNQIKSGGQSVTIDLIRNSIKKYGVNPKYYWDDNASIFLEGNNSKGVTQTAINGGEKIRAVVIDNDDKEKIAYLPYTAVAGFIKDYPDGNYTKHIPKFFSIPGYNNGSAITMKVEGDSMYPTLRNEDYVIAEPVFDKEYIEPKEIYIIFHKNMRPLIKRVILDKERRVLIYSSDNMDYNDQSINSRTLYLDDILFLFQYKKKISGASEIPADVSRYLDMVDRLMKQNSGLIEMNGMLMKHQFGIDQSIKL